MNDQRAEAGRQVVMQLLARMDALTRINEQLVAQNAKLTQEVEAQNKLLHELSAKQSDLSVRLDVMAQALMDGDEYMEAAVNSGARHVAQNAFQQLGHGLLNGMLGGIPRPPFVPPPHPGSTGHPPPGARVYTGQRPPWRQP